MTMEAKDSDGSEDCEKAISSDDENECDENDDDDDDNDEWNDHDSNDGYRDFLLEILDAGFELQRVLWLRQSIHDLSSSTPLSHLRSNILFLLL